MAAEARWFLVNYLLLNAVCFVFAVLDGLVLMATYGGSIPGWDGSPVQQLLFYALTFVMFLPFVFGIPVLLVALLAWRLAIRLVGHPRLTAYLVATIMVVWAAILIERTEPLYLAIVLVAVLAYATIVRLPPRAASQHSGGA
ncbi:MAG: hypothetical protein H0V49_00495 [Nocardioidaceae bacterium]|nr:hypothetical protein [Nocardioidaceae bacterium]